MHDLMSTIECERLKNHALPFIALTETWLKSYIADAQLHIPGYCISRCDRNKRVGGGVLLYSHEDLTISSCEVYDDDICQALFNTFDASSMCIANVYIPPNATHSSFYGVLKFLRKCISELNDDSYKLCIVGDFNFPIIDWESSSVSPGGSSESSLSASAFLSFMADHFLNQYVMTPTRGNNILDIFVTNSEHLVTNITSKQTDLSDHNIVDVMMSFNPTVSDSPHVHLFDEDEFRSLDFNNADFEVINERLHEVDWEDLRSSCTYQEFPALFTDTLFQICSSVVPKKKKPTGRPRALNALRRRKKRLKARLRALEQSNGDPGRISQIKNDIALICYEIKEAIVKRLDQREKNAVSKIKANPKFFYSYAKSFSQTKSSINMLFNKDGDVTTNKKEMADLLQNQFSSVYSNPESPDIKDPDFIPPPINKAFQEYDLSISDEDILSAIKEIKLDAACGPDGIPTILLKSCAEELCSPIKLIWEESLNTGTVPDFYKHAYVSPLYKKGNRAEAVNYRPVSLTSHIVKVYERVLRKVMVQYIEDNNILSEKQHGFRSGRSCLTQMLSHFDDIMEGLIDNKDTDAIYLDYAKAFDKVDHRLLLSKLQSYGFSAQIIKWVESFLTGRTQSVVLNGQHSIIQHILSGVPQGTVLGPILFILFINDLQGCVLHSKVGIFADDTRISKQIASESDVTLLQQDLDRVVAWSKLNNMKLHEDKFELIIHKYRQNNPLYELPFISELMTYTVSNGETLVPVHKLRDLGVIVTSDLSWSTHISTIACKARSVASWVLSVFKTRDRVTMLTLYKSLVRSHLEYCCPLWNPWKVSDIQLLEGVQRTFTNRIGGVQHLNYWDRMKALNLMSLQRRRERYIILQMWKTLHGLCPNDINIEFNSPTRHGLKAKVPPLASASMQRHQTSYDASFAVHGPRLWNTIPSSFTNEPDFQHFKNRLTEFILTVPDTPPVTGYVSVNGNSLLDWNIHTQGWSADLMA